MRLLPRSNFPQVGKEYSIRLCLDHCCRLLCTYKSYLPLYNTYLYNISYLLLPQ
nr:MAG TPA: hypothetical protein [Caudoviricetes sp.]